VVIPWLLIYGKWVTNMSREISSYEKEVIKRIEEIRTQEGITQESFAELMDISIGQYKRFTNYEARVSVEALHNLAVNFPLDIDYILFGRHKGKYTVINALVCEELDEKAKYFDEMAAYFRDKHKIRLQEMTRRNERAKSKKPRVDYVTDKGDVIETDTKK